MSRGIENKIASVDSVDKIGRNIPMRKIYIVGKRVREWRV